MDEVGSLDIAIRGEGVTPETVPADLLAGLAYKYLVALRRTAEEQGIDLGLLRGAKVKAGSAAYSIEAVRTEPARRAIEALDHAMKTPGANEREHLAALAAHVRSLPEGWVSDVGVNDQVVAAIPSIAARRETVSELTTRRMRITGILTEPDTKLRVLDLQTNKAFQLSYDAEALGAAWAEVCDAIKRGEQVTAEVKALLHRDAGNHRILGGEARRLRVVGGEWTVDGLLGWFRSNFDPA